MGFTREFSNVQIDKMKSGSNGELFERLKEDVLKGEVFPAVRKGELHFYYRGGCLYKFSGGSFRRDKNYEKYGQGLKESSGYQRAKRENEIKHKNALGGESERQLLDSLYSFTYNQEKCSDTVVLDIEVNLGGQSVRKCDLVLLNTQTDEIMFVEGKVFSDSRVSVAISFTPEVIEQVNSYSSAIAEQRQIILEQYAKHVEIVNGLFGTHFNPPKKLITPAKLLVYGTPKEPTKNGEYTVSKINEELGEENIMWVEENSRPTLDEVWHSLTQTSV